MSDQKARVLEILEKISPFPIQKRRNITEDKQGYNKGVVLGKVYSWKMTKDGRQGIITGRRTETPKYKGLFEEASKLMTEYDPKFIFSSIQINDNHKASKHKDSNNVGCSYIIGLGDYTGGEVRVYTADETSYVDIDIKDKFTSFDGSTLPHETLDFKGTRFTLVFYNVVK